jgi:hypothetical protein
MHYEDIDKCPFGFRPTGRMRTTDATPAEQQMIDKSGFYTPEQDPLARKRWYIPFFLRPDRLLFYQNFYSRVHFTLK